MLSEVYIQQCLQNKKDKQVGIIMGSTKHLSPESLLLVNIALQQSHTVCFFKLT